MHDEFHSVAVQRDAPRPTGRLALIVAVLLEHAADINDRRAGSIEIHWSEDNLTVKAGVRWR